MVMAVAYQRRLALVITALAIVLICLAAGGGIEMAIALTAGAAVAVYDLADVRNRSKLIRTGTLAGGTFLVSSMAAGLLAENFSWMQMLVNGAWAGGSGLAAGFLTLGLLPFLERLFGVCTNVSLLELCDPNQPLLRRLALEAPGTYNHSLQIGAMAEAAAEAIGANGLLARVGSMFHDVGKINKPHYFIENKADRESRHGQLSPAMSTLVIIAHAREGLEMAREYGMPAQLHEFITSHHGTTVVEYFYTEAKRENPEVNRDEFRYHGPKPRSKEAAIVMISDMVESAARTLSDPTPKRIETLVAELVHKRLDDGQLDECELTLAEVRRIEISLVKSLTGIYHGRIKYPKLERETGRPASAG
jgi:putative nucleotidyltransferase with HDIG domain